MNNKRKNLNSRFKLTYFVGSGNNSRMVRHEFHNRSRWKPAISPTQLASLNDGNGLSKVTDVAANFLWTRFRKDINFERVLAPKRGAVLINHFANNRILVTKSGLFETLESSCSKDNTSLRPQVPFLPETYLLDKLNQTEPGDKTSRKFWIVKPASGTNRGHGIKLYENWNEVLGHIVESKRKWIVQKYIERPLLISKQRKFDIRCFVLLDGNAGYLHKLCYARTSSIKYSLNSLNSRAAHLTNDAVQKKHAKYGKFEDGNKLTLEQLGTLIRQSYGYKDAVSEQILPGMKLAVLKTLRAALNSGIDSGGSNASYSFELFGFDFLVDENLKVYLLEVNENPCLEQSCKLLDRYITKVLDDLFEIVLSRFCNEKGTYKLVPETAGNAYNASCDRTANLFERVV